jgi:broad-specificity NMP kinase
MVKDETIRIVISGGPGCGKTTMAVALRDFLTTNGFTDVHMHDFDVDNDVVSVPLQETRFGVIKDRSVVIDTVQLRMNSTNVGMIELLDYTDLLEARLEQIAKYVGAEHYVDSIGPIFEAIDKLKAPTV